MKLSFSSIVGELQKESLFSHPLRLLLQFLHPLTPVLLPWRLVSPT